MPNQCAPDGALFVASSCWASGSCGAIALPNSAQTTQNSKIAAPATNVGRRSSSRHGGSSPRPVRDDRDRGGRRRDDLGHSAPPRRSRGFSTVDSDVGDQRGHHVHHADDQHAGLEHREVLGLGGLVDQVPDALVVEQRLHHHQAADQVAGLGGDDGDRRQQRVAQHVPPDHHRSLQALQRRGARVVGVRAPRSCRLAPSGRCSRTGRAPAGSRAGSGAGTGSRARRRRPPTRRPAATSARRRR